MLKKHERTFNSLQQLSDAVAIAAAWLTSFYIRFSLMEGGQSGLSLFFLYLTPLLIALTLFYNYKNELYVSNRYYSWYKEILSVIKSNLQAIFTFIIAFYFIAPNRLSRITLMIYLLISIIFTITVRLLARNFIRNLRTKGRNLRHVILVGHGSSVSEYVEAVYNIKCAGICITGWIDSKGKHKEHNIPEIKIEDIDNYHEMIVDSHKITVDAVIIGYPSQEAGKLKMALKISHKLLAPVFVLPDIAFTFINNKIEDFEGIPMIKINSPKMGYFDIFVKRSLDLFGSTFGLLLLSPLYAVISIAVKLTSKGPIFYGQERMSLDGEKFKMWKFRSMKIDAEEKSGDLFTKISK